MTSVACANKGASSKELRTGSRRRRVVREETCELDEKSPQDCWYYPLPSNGFFTPKKMGGLKIFLSFLEGDIFKFHVSFRGSHDLSIPLGDHLDPPIAWIDNSSLPNNSRSVFIAVKLAKNADWRLSMM